MDPIVEVTEHLYKYVLPKDCTEQEKQANTIPADVIVQSIKRGKSVEIVNAMIDGVLQLDSVIVEGRITIQRTKVKGRVDCSYAQFIQLLRLDNCTFESDVDFTAATVKKDIYLNGGSFEGAVDFTDVQIKGALYAQACTFLKEANFMACQVQRRAVFMGTAFKQQAMFTGCRISGSAFFESATFAGEANFVSAWIDDRAMFDGVTFAQNADFARAHIGDSAEFNQTIFKKDACFHGVTIQDSGFFKKVDCSGKADFSYIRTGSNAEFTASVFRGTAVFNSAEFGGHTVFNECAFIAKADFSAAVFRGGSAFAKVRFSGDVFFYSCEFNMDAGFGQSVFEATVSFLNATFRTLIFGPLEGSPTTQFRGNIDFRGCTYDTIAPVSVWKKLVELQEPYDRQPFAQMEQAFRRAGHDHLANRVYHKRKRVESDNIRFLRFGVWMLDRFHWWVTGYGVELWRLLIGIVLVVIAGSLVFLLDGAVQPSQPTHLPVIVRPLPEGEGVTSLRYMDALRVSFRLFLPVEIPSGSGWKPSSQCFWGILRFTDFATLLKLLGWILVPVGLAGLTGWLKR